MAETEITLVTSGVKPDGGASPSVDVTDAGGTLRLTLTVTGPAPSYTSSPPYGALGGLPQPVVLKDPTLDVVVETSPDGSSGWRELGAFQRATGPVTERRVFTGADRFVRCRWRANSKVVGVAAGFTFGVEGHAL